MLQRRRLLAFLPLVVAVIAGIAGAESPATRPESAGQPASTQPAVPLEKLEGFRTVETAVTTELQQAATTLPQAGYLGIAAGEADGRLLVQHVEPGSPADTAGFREGDAIVGIGGDGHPELESLRQWLLSQTPGAKVTIAVKRDGREIELSAVIAPASRPMKLAGQRAVMGVRLSDVPQGEGAVIDRVSPDMPAERAGLQPGDVVVELDGVPVSASQSLTDALGSRAPNDEVKLGVKRDGKHVDVRVKLVADRLPNPIFGGVERTPRYFKKSVYRLAVVGVEFPDHKHNSDISTNDWEQSLFSTGTYTRTSATGQNVHGSLRDYYQEVSAGNLRVEGKMFDWVAVAKNRSEYAQATGDTQKMLPEALDKLLEREGKTALDGFDGIAFIYAGDRVATNRGGLFWPHKGLVPYRGARWDYLIAGEGGRKMTNISVFCHEFGHMLGLPDLYARPENPGSEGLGVWCLMSNQLPNGRPQHMSAWCKEQLGWLKPAVIDPSVKQKLVLSPVEGSARECYKVLIRSNGSEYLLLENRRKTGFDTDLPGQGLVIWHVVGNKPFLVESHGITGPVGPRAYPQDVPFPTSANHSLTPFTTPSSRSQLGGGLAVFISEIERRPDGRITFAVGYQYF